MSNGLKIGKLLEVDLSAGKTSISEIPNQIVSRMLGGRGINVWMLYCELDPKVSALSPNNILILSCGLLTGSNAPTSGRLHLGTKSPLSHLLGSSNIGGYFGARLRSAGFQVLLIRGRSPKASYVLIEPQKASLKDASGLWGMETFQVEMCLRQEIGDPAADILTIGPAGENGVLFASAIHGGKHAAGRTGIGAVMGSKNLKAIVVSAPMLKHSMDDKVRDAVKTYGKAILSAPRYSAYATYGIASGIRATNDKGYLATRNFRSGQFEHVDKIEGHKLNEYKIKASSCYRCPVHCKARIRVPSGRFAVTDGHRPEYESVIALGSKCGLKDTEALFYLNDLCSRLGLDTLSTGAVIAFAMDLFEQGILNRSQTGGIELTWGNATAMESLIKQITHRQHLGAVLAQGVRQAARLIGPDAERFAYHVKGIELSGTDPRGLMGTALGFAVSPRGPDFTHVYCLPETRYTPEQAKSEFGTPRVADRFDTYGKASLVKRCMIVSAVLDCVGLCKIPALSIMGKFDLKQEANLLSVLTSSTKTPADLLQVGERTLQLERLFNLKHGATSADDRLPDFFLQDDVLSGPSAGHRVRGLPQMIAEFYETMGWDSEGVPFLETLQNLDLTSLLEKVGIRLKPNQKKE